MADLASRELYAYEPPVSLWGLVKQYVPENELQEVKNMLGESLVEQSVELQEEVNTLLDIWQDYRDETTKATTTNSLPEPPILRERLKQEIQFFVENLREKAKENGRDPEMVLSRHNSDVIEYALNKNSRPGTADTSSRPSTAHSSRDGRETPMRSTPTSDKLSLSSTVSDEVESMNDKLTVLKFDDVVQHLRETLEEEVSQLLKDITFLQQCLDDEVDYRETTPNLTREPTLSELKQERTSLEKELMSSIDSKPAVPSIPRRGSGSDRRLPSPLSPSSPKMRPSPPTSAHRRLQPMKASHSIATGEANLANEKTLSGMSRSSPVDEGSDSASRIRQKLGSLPGGVGLVKVASISAQGSPKSSPSPPMTPSPPSSGKPGQRRPGSANRFRKMVVDCRDTT